MSAHFTTIDLLVLAAFFAASVGVGSGTTQTERATAKVALRLQT